LAGSYAAAKRWRLAHPEEARRIGRESQEKRRRRMGCPIRVKRVNPEKQKEDEIKAKVLEIRKSLKMQATK
jgi:hypothetical protein